MQLNNNAAINQLKRLIPVLKAKQTGCGVLFKLSRLNIKRDNKEHIVIASNILKDQLRKASGEMLTFADGDIMVIFHEPQQKLLHECVYQIQYLFDDYFDPTDESMDPANIIKVFSLRDDFNAFEKLCAEKMGKSANDNQIKSGHSMINFISSRIEDNLSALNWSKMINAKHVFTVTNQPTKLISEFAVDHLAISEFSGDDFYCYYNSHLRGFIRDYLDLRILIKLVEVANDEMEFPIMVGLSAATIKSDDFIAVSKSIKESQRQRIIISIDLPEIYQDLSEFVEFRDMLLGYGYKLCLNGLDNLSFLQTDRKQLGFDLVKLKWEPNLFKQNYNELEEQLKNKIKATGSSRVILSNCASSKALILGNALGISMYQGD